MKYTVSKYEDEKCIVRIHKPILTAEERRAREDEVRKALVQFEIERRRNKK
jgi:hypothetical protein